MKNIGVILAGSGYLDGAEIREAVLTLLAIDKLGANAICLAPNIDQYHVINHLNQQEQTDEKRNMMQEAARIARGDIHDIATYDHSNLNGIILPGGFGVAKNFCNFAFKGSKAEVLPSIKNFILQFHNSQKPIGAICISPALMALILGHKNVEVTIGNDPATSKEINATGAKHIDKNVNEAHIDNELKVISTPAYMYGDAKLKDIYEGIETCVNAVIQMS